MHTIACTKSWVPSLALQKLDAGAHTCTPSTQETVRKSKRVILSYIARGRIAWNNWETLPGEIKGEEEKEEGKERK